jgi:hypothetical protein
LHAERAEDAERAEIVFQEKENLRALFFPPLRAPRESF